MTDMPNRINTLEEFDRFCRFIDGMNMGGFVENDFMSKKIQAAIRADLAEKPTPQNRVIGCMQGDTPSLIDAAENMIKDAEVREAVEWFKSTDGHNLMPKWVWRTVERVLKIRPNREEIDAAYCYIKQSIPLGDDLAIIHLETLIRATQNSVKQNHDDHTQPVLQPVGEPTK